MLSTYNRKLFCHDSGATRAYKPMQRDLAEWNALPSTFVTRSLIGAENEGYAFHTLHWPILYLEFSWISYVVVGDVVWPAFLGRSGVVWAKIPIVQSSKLKAFLPVAFLGKRTGVSCRSPIPSSVGLPPTVLLLCSAVIHSIFIIISLKFGLYFLFLGISRKYTRWENLDTEYLALWWWMIAANLL